MQFTHIRYTAHCMFYSTTSVASSVIHTSIYARYWHAWIWAGQTVARGQRVGRTERRVTNMIVRTDGNKHSICPSKWVVKPHHTSTHNCSHSTTNKYRSIIQIIIIWFDSIIMIRPLFEASPTSLNTNHKCFFCSRIPHKSSIFLSPPQQKMFHHLLPSANFH
jgi:hypothetical protein